MKLRSPEAPTPAHVGSFVETRVVASLWNVRDTEWVQASANREASRTVHVELSGHIEGNALATVTAVFPLSLMPHLPALFRELIDRMATVPNMLDASPMTDTTAKSRPLTLSPAGVA